MLKPNKTNIILALCTSGILVVLAFCKRYAALPTVPVAAFYVVPAVFFLLRCKVCRKQYGV